LKKILYFELGKVIQRKILKITSYLKCFRFFTAFSPAKRGPISTLVWLFSEAIYKMVKKDKIRIESTGCGRTMTRRGRGGAEGQLAVKVNAANRQGHALGLPCK
jgi:hypothetical protein